MLPSFDPAGPAMDDDGRGPAPAIDDRDVRAFVEGRHCRLYRWLGGRVREVGARFAVWAPGALSVSVIGDFNRWDVDAHPARRRADDSGAARRARVPALLEQHDPHEVDDVGR